ncbi:MAG: hypothetical protein II983_04475 [Firmicutes bacterium]|nr:hypothetical protein [Bacillota bacterium]
MKNIYVGLIIEGGTEPPSKTKYKRQNVPNENSLAFFDAAEFAYETVTHIAHFKRKWGKPFELIELEKPVFVPAGVAPFVHNNCVYCGVPVTAKAVAGSASQKG